MPLFRISPKYSQRPPNNSPMRAGYVFFVSLALSLSLFKLWFMFCFSHCSAVCNIFPDSKVHGANMGPTWVLSAPDGPHVPCYLGYYIRGLHHNVTQPYIDGLVQNCSISIASALEIQQSCTKPSIWRLLWVLRRSTIVRSLKWHTRWSHHWVLLSGLNSQQNFIDKLNWSGSWHSTTDGRQYMNCWTNSQVACEMRSLNIDVSS